MKMTTPADLIAATGSLFNGFPTDSVAVHLIGDEQPLGVFRCDKQALNTWPHLALSKLVGEAHPDKAIIVGFNAEQNQLDTMELWLHNHSVNVQGVFNVFEDDFIETRSGSRYPMTEVYISDFHNRDLTAMDASSESIVNGAWLDPKVTEEQAEKRVTALLKTLDATDEPLDVEAVNEAIPLALFNIQHRDIILLAAATGRVHSADSMHTAGKFLIQKSQDYRPSRVQRFQEAVQQVLVQTPTFQKPTLLTLLAWTYLYQDQRPAAIDLLTKALDIDPNYRLAKLMLTLLMIQS